MSTIALEIKGLDELVKNFDEAPIVVANELSKAIKKSATYIQRYGRIEAPVRTGYLRSQIVVSYPENVIGLVTAKADYSAAVEARNPYMQRGVQISELQINEAFNQANEAVARHLMK